MNVAGVATNNAMLQAATQANGGADGVGVAVLDKAMEQAATVTSQVVESAAAPPPPSTPGLGEHADVYA
ncbi:MAG: putative motility protein [Actinomycetota bacterium]